MCYYCGLEKVNFQFIFNERTEVAVMDIQIGRKIHRLRLERGLTQQELADRCELSKGFISQLERDLTSPSIATLSDILECLGTSPGEFFTEAAVEKNVYTEEDMFVKSEEGREIVWLVPNAQKNMMEPILVSLLPGERTAEDTPHEGEEFGYVLQGTGVLVLGEKTAKIKKGHSFYYQTKTMHHIENRGKSKLVFLWISTPPSF